MTKQEDDLDLFKAAFEELDSDEIFKGKFGSPESESPSSPPPNLEEIEQVKEAQDLRFMEDTFGVIQKKDHSKYWVPSLDEDEQSFESLLDEDNKKASKQKQVVREKRTIASSPWERFADASHDAKVIDLRKLSESSAFRELGFSLVGSTYFRIVFGESTLTREALSRWLKGAAFDVEYSPETQENDGLVIVKKTP